MKIFNKFIWSKKEPSNKNDIWFDGSTWRMYTEEAWQSFTLPVDAADKVAKVIENASEVYQEKLNAGYGIVIEGNTISLDMSSIDIDTTHNIGSIELFNQLIIDRSHYSLNEEDINAISEGKLITTTNKFNTKIPITTINHITQADEVIGYYLVFYVDYMLYQIYIDISSCSIRGGLSIKENLSNKWLSTNDYTNEDKEKLYEVEQTTEELEQQLTELSEELEHTTKVVLSLSPRVDRNTTKLTELSAEVEKKVDTDNVATINGQSLVNGGNIVIEGGEKPIFKAVYGTTTIDEVIAAYESGIVVHCDYKNYCYVLSQLLGGEAYFSTVDGQISSRLFCSNNSNWSVRNFTLEQTSNKTTSLSDKSTDSQYPSAKAVYDALQNVGGGSGGDDTSLREAIFGKTTSKEFAINGYHAQTADTLEVNIAQGEVFHFRLETLGAAMTKYQLYVKYEGDSTQTTLFYFSADEHYSMYAQKPIVELGVNTSSGWVTEKGNVRLTVTQGGIKEPYNLMELGVITIEDSVDNIDVLKYVPDLLKFKQLKVLSQFTYSAERSKKGSIILNTENANMGVALENLMGAAINTHYIIDLNLDKNRIVAYVECHSNSFGNPQVTDSNQGKNFGKTALGYPIDKFVINLPLLAGDKFTFYGK